MQNDHIPSPLARAVLKGLPPLLLQRGIDALMRRMKSVHPRLFVNLEQLDAATIRIEPSDLPHRFLLSYGAGKTSLVVAESSKKKPNACIKGSLDALLNLLEGRIDGDKLFFSRELQISGDTSVVVALRNTLDREEINVLQDTVSLFGPFAKPAREIVLFADKIARHVRERLTELNAKADS